MAGAPACRVLPSAGGWYGVVQVPSLEPEESLVVSLLRDDGVLAHPGYFFDFPRESFLIVSLLPPEGRFADGHRSAAAPFPEHAGAMTDLSGRRHAGLLVPLFSCPSSTSWGIGEIGDLPPLTRWLAGAGQRVLQLLPLNEMAPGQQSPYSAISAMAIDPVYIRVADVPEFAAAGGERSLDRRRARTARRGPAIAVD